MRRRRHVVGGALRRSRRRGGVDVPPSGRRIVRVRRGERPSRRGSRGEVARRLSRRRRRARFRGGTRRIFDGIQGRAEEGRGGDEDEDEDEDEDAGQFAASSSSSSETSHGGTVSVGRMPVRGGDSAPNTRLGQRRSRQFARSRIRRRADRRGIGAHSRGASFRHRRRVDASHAQISIVHRGSSRSTRRGTRRTVHEGQVDLDEGDRVQGHISVR
mmetsp:Transcript_7993/g.23713  ORF Transcript_7993/g.23713 Transcript_7993/m.23713 type:complete len:215 (-) Transcript_7993:190-834(-)